MVTVVSTVIFFNVYIKAGSRRHEQVCVQTYAIMAEIQNFVNSETPRLKYNSKAIHRKRPTLKWLTLAPANSINTKRDTRAVHGTKHLKLRSGVEALQWSLLVIVLGLLVVALPSFFIHIQTCEHRPQMQ